MHIRSLRRLCEYSILALLAVSVLWKGGKSLESTWLLVGIAALCWLLPSFMGRRLRLTAEENAVWIVTLLFVAWIGCSYLLSKTQNYGLDEVLRTGGLGLILLWYLFIHGHDAVSEPKSPARSPWSFLDCSRYSFEENFFRLIVFLAVLSCISGIVVYALQPVNRFVATFFDSRFHTDYWPNAGAEFLLLAWPIVLLSVGKRIERRGLPLIPYLLLDKVLRFLPIGLILGCLLLTYSRGAFIAFAGQLALLGFFLVYRRTLVNNMEVPLKAIAMSLFIGFLTFVGVNELRGVFHPVQSLAEKVTFQATEGTSSIDERSVFWKQAIVLTAKHPIVGFGPYSFRFVQPHLEESVLATSDHPHNVFLKLSAESGMIAAALFAILIGIVLTAGSKLSLTGKRMSEMGDHPRLGYSLLTISVAGVLAHNLIDYNLQFVGIALPLWISMGILLKHWCADSDSHDHRKKQSASILAMLTVAIAAVLLLVSVREGWYLVTSSFGRHAEVSGNTEQALLWYERSDGEWFTRDLLLSRAKLRMETGDTDGAEKAIREYLQWNSEDARAWKMLGEVLLETGSIDPAIAVYETAFAYGSWNDAGISRGLLEALLAETYTQPTSAAAADSTKLSLNPRIIELLPLIEERMRQFASAIEMNTHFIALSPNPEEVAKVFITLSVLVPEESATFRKQAKRVMENAERERLRLQSRPPGWLW